MQRMSLIFAAIMLVVYFGFMWCFAFAKTVMSGVIVPGLTVGLVAGPAVIVIGVGLSLLYVVLANRAEDRAEDRSAQP